MHDNAPELTHYIDHIYQAAVAPEQWPEFLESLARGTRAATLHLAFSPPADGDRGIVCSPGHRRVLRGCLPHPLLHDWTRGSPSPEATQGRYSSPKHRSRGRASAGPSSTRTGCAPRARPSVRSVFSTKTARGSRSRTLGGFRERSSGPFRNEELDPVRPLVPHLQRALVIHSRVQAAELRAGAAADALDRIFGGVILFDERGAPIVTNRTADRILAMNDGLALDWDGPRASTPQQTAELRRSARRGGKTGAPARGAGGPVMRLARPSGRPALEAVVTPIGRESSPLFHRRAAAAIFLADPDARAEPPPERLRRIYGLTLTEAAVASRIAQGDASCRYQRGSWRQHSHRPRLPEAALRQDENPPAGGAGSGHSQRSGPDSSGLTGAQSVGRRGGRSKRPLNAVYLLNPPKNPLIEYCGIPYT